MMEKRKNGSHVFVQFMVKFGILPILLLLFLVFAFSSPKFIKPNNLITILRTSAYNICIAIGMTMVLLTGGIDLSVGSVLAVAAIFGIKISLTSFTWLAVPVALAFGCFIGLLNGLLIAYVHLPPFIATLGSMTYLRGFAYVLAIDAVINNNLGYAWIGNSSLGFLPWMSIISLLLILLFHFITRKTVFGMRVYAIGGNPQAARFTGINSAKIIVFVYMISGTLAALAGIMISSRNYFANALVGQGYENDAIAAAIVGGTSFTGGKGTIVGTLLGALLIAVLNNGLTILGVSYYWQQVVRGFVIIGAVLLDVARNKFSAKN
jgi:ribose transport system permease protein